jgi:ribose-phosphate pyrophosphokinase
MINTLVLGRSGTTLATRLAHRLQLPICYYHEQQFSDGEISVVLSLPSNVDNIVLVAEFFTPGDLSINSQFLALLVLLRQLEAAHVTELCVFVPCLPYSRSADLQSSPLLLFFEQLKNFYRARLITVDLHDATLVRTYPELIVSVDTSPLWAEQVESLMLDQEKTCVVSPDAGGKWRAMDLAKRLVLPVYVLEKMRHPDGTVSFLPLEQSLANFTVILRDDMVDTANTAVNAALELKKNGASRVIGFFTHAIFSPGAIERLQASNLQKVFIMDTVPRYKAPFSLISLDDILVTTLHNELGSHDERHKISSNRASV